MPDLIRDLFVVLAYIASVGFFLCGVDDFLFDLQFLRHLVRQRLRPHIKLHELQGEPERWIAILVPAWMEGGIVNRMAEYAVKVLSYERYEIFVGVYPNDPETCACVDAISRAVPRIRKVMVGHPGPTSKADCLNAMYRAMEQREIPGQREFEIVALHDSEDVLHPLTLRVYNYFVPRFFEMAQLPVFPLPMPLFRFWVSSTYMDAFCELHLKDMYARETIGGVVPSAGVGTAFHRPVLDELAAERGGDPFRLGNLTEDYMIGAELRRRGKRAGFINYPIDRTAVKKGADGKTTKTRITEIVSVREQFPITWGTAIRQRSRWILGIAFQCWEEIGWFGGWGVRYTLYRDRRAAAVHFINIVGYAVCLYAIVEFIIRHSPLDRQLYVRPLFDGHPTLWTFVIIDSCLLGYRLLQKAFCVTQIFGIAQGMLSVIRYPIDNFINFFATIRATKMYAEHRLFGKQLVWLKTTHVFPTGHIFESHVKKVEDLIMASAKITHERLQELTAAHPDVSIPRALLAANVLTEEEFTQIWSEQSGLPSAPLGFDDVDPALLALYPEEEAERDGFLPIGRGEGGIIRWMAEEPPAETRLAELTRRYDDPGATPSHPSPALALPSVLRRVRNRVYAERLLGPMRRRLFREAISEHAPQAVHEALAVQAKNGQPLPEILVAHRAVTLPKMRELWARTLDCAPAKLAKLSPDPAKLLDAGAAFCLLHQLVPLATGHWGTIDVVHPEIRAALARRIGHNPVLVTDMLRAMRPLLRKLNEACRADRTILAWLRGRGRIDAAQEAELAELAANFPDPLDVLLHTMGVVSPEEANEAFLATAGLPAADPEILARGADPALRDLLPPRIAREEPVVALAAGDGCIVLGAAGLPSPVALLRLRERFSGYAVCWVGIPLSSLRRLRDIPTPSPS